MSKRFSEAKYIDHYVSKCKHVYKTNMCEIFFEIIITIR